MSDKEKRCCVSSKVSGGRAHNSSRPTLQFRLAQGETGIPKIPDSPDTRHAQAQPPRPDLVLAAQRLVDLELKWQSNATWTTEDAAEWQNAINDLKEAVAAAGPAEQPAPPRTIETGTGMGSMGEPICKHDSPNCQHSQPSAPPQPAPKFKHSKACDAQGEYGTDVRCICAAEPSVEARHIETYSLPQQVCAWLMRNVGDSFKLAEILKLMNEYTEAEKLALTQERDALRRENSELEWELIKVYEETTEYLKTIGLAREIFKAQARAAAEESQPK